MPQIISAPGATGYTGVMEYGDHEIIAPGFAPGDGVPVSTLLR